MAPGLTHRRQVVMGLLASAASTPRAAGLVALITAAKPAICAVGIYREVDSPRFTFRGTGFAIGDGSLVATCHHVLPDETKGGKAPHQLAVQLPLADGGFEVRAAEPAARDRAHDLVLLRLSGAPVAPLALADPRDVQEGMAVALIGFPIGGVLGYRPVTHRGMVSSIVTSALPTAAAGQLSEAAVRRLRDGPFELLQLDAVAYPGNSGGPLLDADSGKVVGVVNMVLIKGDRESAISRPTGISYAVPVRYLAELLRPLWPAGGGAPR